MSSGVVESTSNAVSTSVDTITSRISYVVMFIVVLCITIYVVIHLIKMFRKTDLKTVTMLKNPREIPQYNSLSINSELELPMTYNGVEYSYSIWFYLDSVDMTGNPKLIVYRGDQKNRIGSSASTIFYMDPDYVTMHVLVKTNKSPHQTTKRGSLADLHKYNDCDYVRLKVNYVPMQRWVNAILVVDNQYIQLFFDGELRKVVDAMDIELLENALSNRNINDHDFKMSEKGEEYGCSNSDVPNTNGNKQYNESTNICCHENNLCCKDRRMVDGSNGDHLVIGRIGLDDAIQGYMSKVQFLNYAVTIDHARVIYQAGPLHLSILSMLGLPLYGLRNPFYKIGEACSSPPCNSGEVDTTTDDKDTTTTTTT